MQSFLISRRGVLMGTAAVVAASALPPGAAAADAADTLRVRLLENPAVLDPAFWQSSADLWVMDAVLPKLVQFKPGSTWEWELYAAEAVEQTDPKTITFKLKEGLQWSNGFGELTAEDVKFSYERFLDKTLSPPNAGNWALLDRVEVTGPREGKIIFKEPSAAIWGFVLPYDGGHIVSKKAVTEAGGKYGVNIPCTCGPYKITEQVPNQRFVLERDDTWPGTKPQFSRVEMMPVTDAKAAENAVLSGELDWAIVSISSVPTIKDSLPDGLKLEIKTTPNYFWLGLTMANPSLEDVRVRKAIHMEIDRDAILQGAFFGVAEPSNGFASEGMVGHVSTPPVARDVEGAKALLAEAGVTNLTLDLETVAETDKQTAAQIIQANLAEIGITVNINTHEGGAFWSLGEQKGKNLQLHLTEYTTAAPDMSWSTQWFLPEQAGIWNWAYLISEDYKKLHYAAMSELDTKKRDQLFQDLQKIVADSYTFYWIAHPPRPVVYNAKKLEPAMKPNAEQRLELVKKV